MKIQLVKVQGAEISFFNNKDCEFISLTDIARFKNVKEPKDIIKNWMRNKSTIEFLGLWEKINNPDFKGVEFDPLYQEAGSNTFVLSPSKWIKTVKSLGVVSKKGKYGGTYAHKDIAFEFASWVSAEFKLYLIKEFQRLKQEESLKKSLEWDLVRTISKLNYKIHTDAIKENLVPKKLSNKDVFHIYANEADILNIALFNKKAKKWREQNKDKKGNIRDYADIRQLICLSNLESINAAFIRDNLSQPDRLRKLNEIAIFQMKSLINSGTIT